MSLRNSGLNVSETGVEQLNPRESPEAQDVQPGGSTVAEVGGSQSSLMGSSQLGLRTEKRSQMLGAKKRMSAEGDSRTRAMNAAIRTKQCGPTCECHAQSLSQMRDSAKDASEHRVLLSIGKLPPFRMIGVSECAICFSQVPRLRCRRR